MSWNSWNFDPDFVWTPEDILRDPEPEDAETPRAAEPAYGPNRPTFFVAASRTRTPAAPAPAHRQSPCLGMEPPGGNEPNYEEFAICVNRVLRAFPDAFRALRDALNAGWPAAELVS